MGSVVDRWEGVWVGLGECGWSGGMGGGGDKGDGV